MAMKLISMFFSLQHCLYQLFTLIGNDDFMYEFSVEKLVLFSFRGNLGEIEPEKKSLEFFMHFFFGVNVQCCVRVSASDFQVLTRKSGGATAFGNFVRFWLAQLVFTGVHINQDLIWCVKIGVYMGCLLYTSPSPRD